MKTTVNQSLSDLQFIPKWLDEPMYMGGVPVKPDQCSFEGKAVRDLYFQPLDIPGEKKGIPLTDDELEFLRQYVIYFIHAPIWDIAGHPDLSKVRKKAFNLKPDYEAIQGFIWNDLIDMGIDPF